MELPNEVKEEYLRRATLLMHSQERSQDAVEHPSEQVERREVNPEVVKHMDQKLKKLLRDAYELGELGQNTGIFPTVIHSMDNVLTPIIGQLMEYLTIGSPSSSSSEDEEEYEYEGRRRRMRRRRR